MTTIERGAQIDRPAAAVWAVVEDVRQLPRYSPSTVEVAAAPDRLSAVGQTFRQTVSVLGRSYTSEWAVTGLEAGRCVAIEGRAPAGARYCLVEQVDPLGPGRSRLTVRITFTLPLGLLGRVAERLGVQGRAEQEAEEILANLKRHLEGSAVG